MIESIELDVMLAYNLRMQEILITFFITFFIGGIGGFFTWKFIQFQTLKRAQEEAEEIISDIKEATEIRDLELKEKQQEIEMALWTKVENEHLKLEEKIEDLQSLIDERKAKYDQKYLEDKKKLDLYAEEIKKQQEIVHQSENKIRQKKNHQTDLNKEFIDLLSQKLGADRIEIKNEIIEQMLRECERTSQQMIIDTEEEFKEHAETKAKRILALAIDKFARPYCPERGIAGVHYPDELARQLFAKPEITKAVTEFTGCDIILDEQMDLIGVAGFDPVRRELTRRLLERLMKEKRAYSPEFVKKTGENLKRDLLRQIKSDGDQLAKELRLEGLHPEIRQMMGSLRYRYSFTQNQYFHCGEVGWLSGLLAAELNTDIRKARRIGMLHDIGKAMDHAADGGHAVIGADFIQQRNEAVDVVHAVRAHHFDEQPNTDHAFIVIAADAISGARPGARRSTMETYNQKVSEIQEIARSFEGVTDCFVLNGGRECRVLVNSRKVGDVESLELSRKIAQKIEQECNYPGQIKVIVVRETIITETTRKEMA